MKIEDIVTIIIPVYNTEKYLEKCLNSVLEQSHKNLEIILINDGSTDNSLNICKEFQKLDNRIKIINQENNGVSVARNKGLDIASGEYIAFIDSDDFIEKNMIETMLNNIKKENADISEIDFTLTNLRDYSKKKKLKFYEVSENNASIIKLFSGSKIENIVCSKLYKKSIIGDIRFDEKLILGEDLYFNFKVLLKQHKIVIDTRNSYYNYVIVPTSKMNKKISWKHIEYINFLENIVNEVPKDLVNFAEAKVIREKIKIFKKIIESNDFEYEEYRNKYIKEIKKYSFFKCIKYLNVKSILLIYLMKISPYIYIYIYDKLQKQ